LGDVLPEDLELQVRATILARLHDLFKPPPRLNVDEWAEEKRILSSESNVIGGKWTNYSYQVEPMRCFKDPDVEEIVICSSAQIGKTDIMLNILGYIIDCMPAGVLVIFPTIENARIFSRTRLEPMIRDCAALAKKMTAYKSRDKSSTILFKQYPGGFARIIGAKSESDLASMPLPYIFGDEIDKYISLKKGGDAYSLALERSKMQPFNKSIATSTPSLAGESKIQAKFDASDQRHFYVPCPECGVFQILIFKNIKWESKTFKNVKTLNAFVKKALVDKTRFMKSKRNKLRVHFYNTSYYKCPECQAHWTDLQVKNAVRDGYWKAHQPFTGTAGFKIWELYSLNPKITMARIIAKYLKMKDNPDDLHTFTNATLGEVYNLPSESMKETALYKRREKYYCKEDGYKLPAKGAVITCGVDVQPDRLEATVRLWGADGESWGLEYYVWEGDVINDVRVWNNLDRLIEKEYIHASGVVLKIEACAIDTGYAATDAVYLYINRKRWPRLAIKGRGGVGEPLVRRSSKPDKLEVPLHLIGVNTAKNTIYQRSLIARKGPGYIHWNENFSAIYFEQFTAEKRVRRFRSGNEEHVWEKPPGRKNEALDTEVYAYAALYNLMIPDMQALVDDLDPKKVKEREKEKQSTIPSEAPYNRFTSDI